MNLNIKEEIKKAARESLKELYGLKDEQLNAEKSTEEGRGDYSLNAAMSLAGRLKKNPLEIARQLENALKNKKEIKKMTREIKIAGPGFINFYLKESWLQAALVNILKSGRRYGASSLGRGKTVVVDYSSPNIAKKMHAGHLRSTVIGAAIYNIHKFLGYRTIGDNHLGDWGTQFGKLICQYKKKYGQEIKREITVEEMEELYLDFHRRAKEEPAMEEAARAELKKLQAKDNFNYRLWRLFYRVSLKEFKSVYQLLGVKFNSWHGESFYHGMLSDIVKEALEKKAAEKSQGAVIIDLGKFNLPPFLIQKSDGAFLYTTSDLATMKYRRQKYQPVKNLYVVANQQALHFEQLFRAAEILGYGQHLGNEHIKFGLLLDSRGKKMSTREGGVVDLKKIIAEGIKKAEAKIKEKNPRLRGTALQKTAHALAIGAIKYNDLSQNRLNDINFNWDKMLSLESGSAPYLQYTYVRVKSIFKKTRAGQAEKFSAEELREAKELKLIKDLLEFPERVKSAGEQCRPNLIAVYLEELARDFHSFYERVPISKAPPRTRKARLALIRAVAQVVKSGLGLLGIDCPEKM